MSTSARRRIGRRPGAGGPWGEEAGFWLRSERVEQDNQALRQERDGLIERIKERIAGIYRELQALPCLVKRSFFETATAIGPSLPDSASSGAASISATVPKRSPRPGA